MHQFQQSAVFCLETPTIYVKELEMAGRIAIQREVSTGVIRDLTGVGSMTDDDAYHRARTAQRSVARRVLLND